MNALSQALAALGGGARGTREEGPRLRRVPPPPLLSARRPPRPGSVSASKMAGAGVLLWDLRRLCRVLLFLSQFYILSGGGELGAGVCAGPD